MADNKLPRPTASAGVEGPRPESGPNKRKRLTPGGRLTPRQRLALICSVEEGRFSVSEACRRYGISRFTFYKWKKRYEEAKAKEAKILKALSPKKRTYAQPHPRRSANLFVGEVLEVVKRKPSLSSREIAEHTCLSETGVWGVLKRIGLAKQEERRRFRRLHLSLRPWLGLLFVVEYLLGGAFLPEIPLIYPLLAVIPKKRRPLALYVPLLFLVFWIFFRFNQALFISQPTLWGRAGLVLSEIALLFGMFFFLYSLKYYLTLTLVLLSSRGRVNGANGVNGVNGVNGGLNGFLNGRLNGLFNGKLNGRGINSAISSSSRIHSALNGRLGNRREMNFANAGSSRIHLPRTDWYWGSALNGRLSGFLNGRLNGLFNGLNHLRGGKNNTSEVLSANGLNGLNGNNLDRIKLKEEPFVSIHLPFYNEKRVASRILEACSKLNYENFEILVLDDSNDGTTEIVEEWTKKDKRIRLAHRPNREGWKGGALRYALERMDERTEYVVVFDADFIPFPDTIEWFLRYFHFLAGGLKNIKKSKIAAVQGYQWHVLNKDENWITRGIRGEYAGSYIIERSGTELFGSLKQIAGSVYMIRADVLKKFGWGTSITEDFQLTLRLYEAGYKVIYTPYIQGPAECVSTLKRLIRQRMRWAEGHTHNVRKMFHRLWYSPSMNFTEKLEFLYLSPYYLQSLFFLVGTLAWLAAEIIFRAKLPFWTATWGWALVFTNMLSLVVMNAAGLFIEESDKRDYKGLLSFIAMTYIIVPFQAYAAIKGFFEKEEGHWFRTPKSGLITIEVVRGHFTRLFGWLFPRRAGERVRRRYTHHLSPKTYHLKPSLALATAGNQFDRFRILRRRSKYVGRAFLSLLLAFSVLLTSMAPYAPYFVRQIRTRASGMILGPVVKENYDDSSNLEELKPKEISPSTYAFKTLDGDVVEIGTEKHSPPQPYLKLDKWEGEASLKVNIPYKTGKSPFQEGDKLRYSTSDFEEQEGILGWIRWLLSKIQEILGFSVRAEERPKVEIEFYPKQPEEITEEVAGKPHTFKINEEGGVEFDTILYEKPETNQIVFPIETTGLKFYYQPELTQKEIDEGAFRPENVVGSYAVYHESKSGDYTALGGKNYRAGKAFHIYRPKITDANGNWTWGELNITKTSNLEPKTSILTITIDQSWLDNAVYPVTIDPRFGYETAGSNYLGTANNGWYGSLFTSPSNAGTASSITAYGRVVLGSAFFKGTMVRHSDLTIITNGIGNEVAPDATAGWDTSIFGTAPTLAASTDYVISFVTAYGVGLYRIYYDAGDANQGHYETDNNYSSPTNPSDITHDTNKYSIYATFAAKIDTSTSANATAYSFQRKTWYDGTRLWSAFYSGTEIEFWYSTDWGSNWTQNTSATISVSTNDFTIEADSSDAFISYTNGADIEARKASSYPGTGFSWGTATIVYDGIPGVTIFYYSALTRDSNNKVWITTMYMVSASYRFQAIQSTNANDISAWGTASTLDTSENSNKYGTIVPLSNGEMYAVWIDGTTIEGKKYVSADYAASTSDGHIYGNTPYDWADTRNTSAGYNTSGITANIGYHFGSFPSPYLWRTYLKFDTSSIGSGSTVTQVNLKLTATADNSTVDFDVQIVKQDWSGQDPISAANREAAYDNCLTATLDDNIWRNTNGMLINTQYTSGDLSTTWVNKTGNTYYSLINSKDRDNTLEAGTVGYITVATQEHATADYRPKLHIEYWGSADTIATGGTGMSNNMSAVSDSSGNVHLLYIANFEPPLVDYVAYKKYTTSWQTEVTLDGTAGCDYPTISINTANNDLYAIWVRSNVIYYKKGVSPYGSANWDPTATSWQTSGTNKHVTSNYSGNGMIFAQWTEGTGSPYSVMWDYIIIPENVVALLGLGLLVPGFLRRKRKKERGMNSANTSARGGSEIRR